MSTIRGTKEPQFNREEIRFGLQGGEYSRTIQGLPETLKALIPDLINAGATGVFIQDQSPIATIEYSLGSPDLINGNPEYETPQVVHECSCNEVEKDILDADHSVVNAVNGTASEKLLRKYLNGTDLTDDEVTSLSSEGDSLYSEIKAGRRSVRVYVPTLKISRVVSNTYTVKASQTNVRKIFTTAELEAAEGIPAGILFDLPADTTTKPNRAYGWFKKPPAITITGFNRFSINQEYEYGLWSTVIEDFLS